MMMCYAAGYTRYWIRMCVCEGDAQLPKVLIFVELLLTIPVATAECERRFGRVKIIKTEVRTSLQSSTMTNICAPSWIHQVLVILIQLIRSISGIEIVTGPQVLLPTLSMWTGDDNTSEHELPAVVYSRAQLEVLETVPVLGKCDLSLKTWMVLITLVILYLTLILTWYFQNIQNLVRTTRILAGLLL